MLKEGMKVQVYLPVGETGITPEMRRFHDIVTTIFKKNTRAFARSGMITTYLLEGCVSKMGVPFEFIDDWLIPWEDEVEV